jgi:hypothetical protein
MSRSFKTALVVGCLFIVGILCMFCFIPDPQRDWTPTAQTQTISSGAIAQVTNIQEQNQERRKKEYEAYRIDSTVRSAPPIKFTTNSVLAMDSASLSLYYDKVIQLTGYSDGSYGVWCDTLSTLTLCPSQSTCIDVNDDSYLMCSFFSRDTLTSKFPVADSGHGIYKITLKGILYWGELVPIPPHFKRCLIVSSQFIPDAQLEFYTRHPTWTSLMHNPDKYEGGKIIVRAKVLEAISFGYRMEMDWGKFLLVDCSSGYDNSSNRPIAGDYVKIIGISKGVDSYTTVLRSEIECPRIEVSRLLYVRRQED